MDMARDAAANGYVKSILATTQSLSQTLRVYGDLIPTDDTGSTTTYYTDHYYTSHAEGTIYGARLGGGASDGANDGLACLVSADSPEFAFPDIGSRLVWQK